MLLRVTFGRSTENSGFCRTLPEEVLQELPLSLVFIGVIPSSASVELTFGRNE
ncbi:hypothetical protein VSO92_11860 [Myroides pelagicus]|uniref:hypothetical protein n=1 Tax=Myroides pelagicus TaxID=270914 RepID=UPI002DBB3296|nr:hypothetical protein [Myroides pelagicus]MEC4114796.1 hypothetical protein [Myroides pelagicus]